LIGKAVNEFFAQFIIHAYKLIPDSKLGTFSTLKYINSQNFIKFRELFKAEFKQGFLCCSDTFDNVKGKFPIGFLVWNFEIKNRLKKIELDIYESDENVTKSNFIGKKTVQANDEGKFIVDWIRNFFDKESKRIGYLRFQGTDFQTSSNAFFTSRPTENDIRESKITNITGKNLTEMAIYLTVRHCIAPTWLNNREQFLFPLKSYDNDKDFKNDCIIFTLFHGQNKITSFHGTNHWIPFTAQEVGAKDNFKSNFMSEYIKGKKFSKEAKDTLKSGKELWKYYHSKIAGHRNAPLDASFYDIREFFQGRSEKGTMKQKSTDETYNALIKNLRQNLSVLAEKIKPRVYEYGFLAE
jgi:hypothetical protein